jgi:uncharacterized protein YutE (UPF0331/DUF86 family)
MNELAFEEIHAQEDYRSLMGIYHTAQNAIEVIIDVTAMLNKDLFNTVQDNHTNLQNLIQEEVIDNSLKQGLHSLIGLRNRLAHDYNGIIDRLAWESIQEYMPYLEKFHEGISKWFKEQFPKSTE